MALVVALSPLSPASADLAPPPFEPLPHFPGEVSQEAKAAADKLSELVDASPDRYTGVSITGPNTVSVSLPAGSDFEQRSDAVRSGARAAAGTAVSVQVKQSGLSLADVRRTKEEVVQLFRSGTYKGKVLGVGVDSVKGAVIAYATADSDAARIELKERFGDSLVFRQQDEVPHVFGRSQDSAPHYGGSGIRLWNPPHTGTPPGGVCSTGFSVRKDGIEHMLTAAHCFPAQTVYPRAWASSYTSATPPAVGYYHGAMVTSTYGGTLDAPQDGTQDVYGDFALLQGSGGGYEPRVYNCAKNANPCSALTVGAANYGTPQNGTQVCTSGLTTGQTCRQFVTDNEYATTFENGIFATNLAYINSDQNGDGTYDCAGPDGGDSGGAVYSGTGDGKVMAQGIITGGTDCSAVYTKLSGMRAWNSSFSVLTD